jgi:hypothetical protein
MIPPYLKMNIKLHSFCCAFLYLFCCISPQLLNQQNCSSTTSSSSAAAAVCFAAFEQPEKFRTGVRTFFSKDIIIRTYKALLLVTQQHKNFMQNFELVPHHQEEN